MSVSTPAARSRPFVFSPRAVSDSKSSQTCLDPDASTVRPRRPPPARGMRRFLLARLAVSRLRLASDPSGRAFEAHLPFLMANWDARAKDCFFNIYE